MEGAQVEAATEGLFRFGAAFEDGIFSEVVRQRLPGPRDVAIDFGLNFMLGQCAVFAKVI